MPKPFFLNRTEIMIRALTRNNPKAAGWLRQVEGHLQLRFEAEHISGSEYARLLRAAVTQKMKGSSKGG